MQIYKKQALGFDKVIKRIVQKEAVQKANILNANYANDTN
jgi:hypothetical protein